MARLEELTVSTRASGVVPGAAITVKSVSWTGCEDASGRSRVYYHARALVLSA